VETQKQAKICYSGIIFRDFWDFRRGKRDPRSQIWKNSFTQHFTSSIICKTLSLIFLYLRGKSFHQKFQDWKKCNKGQVDNSKFIQNLTSESGH
jgi:hypothetical protein